MSRFLKSQAWRPTGLLMAYGALTLVWVVLWRFPVLMADDRFFAIASELPRGQQTWAVIEKMFDDCWRLINGRLADGFGTMLFALGNTALRLAMALFYVALTAMLWCYLRLSAEALRRPLPRLSLGAGSGAAWVCWSLAAIWPFTLIGLSTGVAGESVMLMAAVWNYVFPLALLLFALYPLFRRWAGRPMPWWAELLSVPLVYVSFLMHELVTVAGAVLVAVALLTARSRVWTVPVGLITASAIVGVYVKFTAPGLRARTETYQGIDPVLLTSLRAKAVSAAMALNLWPQRDLKLLLVLALALGLAVHMAWRSGRFSTSRARLLLATLSLMFLSVLAWLVANMHFIREQRRVGTTDLDAINNLLGEAIPVLAAAGGFVACTLVVVFLLPKGFLSPLTTGTLLAAFLTTGAVAYSSSPHYAWVHRTFYMPGILAVLVVVMICADVLSSAGEATRPETRTTSLLVPVLLVLVGLHSLVVTGTQLAANWAAWRNVEHQVAAVKAGQQDTVTIPITLPCSDVMWYFNGSNLERTAHQWRIYYGLDRDVPVRVRVPETVHSCPIQ